jgi:hypothetical protein
MGRQSRSSLDNAFHRFNPSSNGGEASSRGGKADHLLFAPDGESALGCGQESFLNVLLRAGNQIAAATQVELALDIFAVALNGFNTETKRMGDLSIAQFRA